MAQFIAWLPDDVFSALLLLLLLLFAVNIVRGQVMVLLMKWRNVNPLEQGLRIASWPLGWIAVAYAGITRIGLDPRPLLSIARSSSNATALTIGGVLLVLAAVYWLAVVRQTLAARDDRRTVRAACKLVAGLVILFGPPELRAVYLLGVWLCVTAAVRLVLLVPSLKSARRIIEGGIAKQEFNWDK